MQNLGSRAYPVCLLDTNAVSTIVKDDSGTAARNFLTWAADGPMMVPCFSPFTLMELRRAPSVLQRFVEIFKGLPCMMSKGYIDLLGEERARYPEPGSIDLCSTAFLPEPFGGDGNRLSNLPWMLDQHQATLDGWQAAAPEIVEGIRSLVSNFQPAGSTYTSEEIREFIWQTTFSQLCLHDVTRDFVRDTLAQDVEVQIDAFPSLKSMAFTVFYKFYADPLRRSAPSDAIDMLIASALPYVEAVITENNQAECLRKTQQQGSFLTGLMVHRVRDLRRGFPPRPNVHA